MYVVCRKKPDQHYKCRKMKDGCMCNHYSLPSAKNIITLCGMNQIITAEKIAQRNRNIMMDMENSSESQDYADSYNFFSFKGKV